MRSTRTHLESAAWDQPRRISRRAVAKGTAWTAPLVLVSLAAPAFAMSGGGLRAAWTEVRHSSAEGWWAFCLTFANGGTEDIEVTSIKVRTTYPSPTHPPTHGPRVVHTFATPVSVTTAHTSTHPLRHCTPMQALDDFAADDNASLLIRYTRVGTPSHLLLQMNDLVKVSRDRRLPVRVDRTGLVR